MTVLVVDDEDLVRKSLFRAFGSRGHKVFMAEGGVRALQIWQEQKPDIVLLDILMPDLSGPVVLEHKPSAASFIVLMSAYKGEYDKLAAVQLGAHDFLAKPFEDIFTTVEKVERGYYEYVHNKEEKT